MDKNFHKLIQKEKTILLPDIGTFFNDDTSLAIEMINKLHAYNVEVIKGEILHDPNICLDYDQNEFYYDKSQKKFIAENYRKLMTRKTVDLNSYEKIFEHAKSLDKVLVLSIYDTVGVDFALNIKCDVIKVASSNITNIPLIKYMSKFDLPIILDTGHSTLEEIARAINILNDNDFFDIFIQHSPLAPPVPVEEQNLNFMVNLGKTFGLPYGLSDHHDGDEMLYAATALGASIVEKGVTPEKYLADQDCAHAMFIDDIPEILKRIKNISKSLGNGTRYLRRDREKYKSRMCIYATKDIKNGEKISEEKISFAMPFVGIGVEEIDNVIGRKLSKDVKKGEPLKKDFLI